MAEESSISKKIFNLRLVAMFSDGTTNDVSQFVTRARIEMNFQEFIMPYYRFILRLPKELIVKINTDRDKVVFAFSSNVTTNDTEDSKIYVPFHEEIILKPIMDLNNVIDYDDRVTKTNDDQKHLFDRYELVALSEEILKTNKPVVSGIYNNCTVEDVVTDLLSYLKNRDVYFHPVDNKKIYEQIIITPSNVYDNIKFLDNVYGIYNREIKMFNHSSGLNILPMSGFDPKEVGLVNLEVRFPSNQTSEEIIEGSYEEISSFNENIRNKNIITRISNVSLIDNVRLFNELIGSEIHLFGMDKYEKDPKINQYSRDIYDRNGKINKVKVLDDIYDNNFNLSKEFNNNKDIMLQVQLNDVDINMDDVFKQFKVEFFNNYYKHYNGIYEILSINQNFLPASKSISVNSFIVLRKINDMKFERKDNNPNT